jgi:hypothetical protein
MKIRYDEKGRVQIAVDDVNYNISGVYPEHHYWRSHVQPFLDDGGVIEPYVASEPSWLDLRTAKLADGGYGSVAEQTALWFDAVASSTLEAPDERLLEGSKAYFDHIAAVKLRYPKPSQ